jgi:hypothetical protein
MSAPHRPRECAHGCGAERPPAHHYRDAGDLTPELAAELGYCPALARGRAREAAQ